MWTNRGIGPLGLLVFLCLTTPALALGHRHRTHDTTTTSTTTAGTTTSTTLKPGPCPTSAGGAFDGVPCLEDELIAVITQAQGQAACERASFCALILRRANRLKDHTGAAEKASGHKQNTLLKYALRDVIGLNAALNSLTGKHSISRALHDELVGITAQLLIDLKHLRSPAGATRHGAARVADQRRWIACTSSTWRRG